MRDFEYLQPCDVKEYVDGKDERFPAGHLEVDGEYTLYMLGKRPWVGLYVPGDELYALKVETRIHRVVTESEFLHRVIFSVLNTYGGEVSLNDGRVDYRNFLVGNQSTAPHGTVCQGYFAESEYEVDEDPDYLYAAFDPHRVADAGIISDPSQLIMN